MMEHNPRHDLLAQAALYALGELEGEELQAFEEIMKEGCLLCRAVESFQKVVAQLGIATKPVQPPAHLRSKLLARVKAETNSGPASDEVTFDQEEGESSPPGLTFVHAGSVGWQEVAPGLRLKPLFFDESQGRMTALVRMDAGCNYAIHRHDKPEELFVLEGTCFCGGRMLYPGDYHRADTDTIHEETSTTDGCLMLVIFSPNNEMLQPAG